MRRFFARLELTPITYREQPEFVQYKQSTRSLWGFTPYSEGIMQGFEKSIETGLAFLIKIKGFRQNRIVGVTGVSTWSDSPNIIRVDAHGINPSEEERLTYSVMAFETLFPILEKELPSTHTAVVLNTIWNSQDIGIIDHLEHCGFKEFPDPYEANHPHILSFRHSIAEH